MRTSMLKTPLAFACFVFVIYMMRQGDITPSKGLRHSLSMLNQRILDSGSRPSTTLCDGVSFDQSFSDSDVNRAQGFTDNLEKMRGGNPLEDWVLNGDEDTLFDDYGKGMIAWVAPWIVLAIISLVTCIGFVINWCCVFGCCKNCCKCCKCCKPAKEQGRWKLYMVISGFFLVCMVGSSAAGLVFSPKVTQGINVTFCSALISVENLVHGETDEEWMGFNAILTSLNEVKAKFNTATTGLTGLGTNTQPMDDAYDDATDANEKLYDENHLPETVRRADPAQTTKYTPDYVANLGPKETPGTYTYYIQQELKTWHDTITKAITEINSAVNSLTAQQTAIATAIDSGIDTAQSITDSLNEVIDTLDDSGPTVKDGVKGAGYGLIALFGVNLLFSLIAILSIVMVGIIKVKFFNKILHLSWCVILLVTILGFILAALTLPASVVMLEACDIFRLTLNDQDFFEKITDKVFSGGSSDAKSILNTCFYGSGLALDELGLTAQLGYFDTIYDQLDKVNEIIPLDGPYTVGNSPPSVVIPAQETLVNQYLTGELPDSTKTVTDLATLNKGTNKASYSCISLRDKWVLNSVSCTDSSYYTFLSTDIETEHVGSKTCIGFVDAWTTKDITQRYTTTYFPTSCSNPSVATVEALLAGFKDNRNDINAVFTAIQSDLTDVKNAHKTFSDQVIAFVDETRQVQAKVKDLKDSLVGEENGLIPNTNCKFVGTDLRNLQISMCTGMTASIYQASIVLLVMAATALFATIFTFCLAKKFSIDKEKTHSSAKHTEGNESPYAFKNVM